MGSIRIHEIYFLKNSCVCTNQTYARIELIGLAKIEAEVSTGLRHTLGYGEGGTELLTKILAKSVPSYPPEADDVAPNKL